MLRKWREIASGSWPSSQILHLRDASASHRAGRAGFAVADQACVGFDLDQAVAGDVLDLHRLDGGDFCFALIGGGDGVVPAEPSRGGQAGGKPEQGRAGSANDSWEPPPVQCSAAQRSGNRVAESPNSGWQGDLAALLDVGQRYTTIPLCDILHRRNPVTESSFHRINDLRGKRPIATGRCATLRRKRENVGNVTIRE